MKPRDASTGPGRTSQVDAPWPPPPSRVQALLARADKLLAEQHLKLQPSSRTTAADASASPRDEVNRPPCSPDALVHRRYLLMCTAAKIGRTCC